MKRLLLFMALLLQEAAAQDYFLFTGTYTNGKSKGIYVHSFDSRTGEARELSSSYLENPSFLALSPNGNYVYAVSEVGAPAGGSVHAFRFDRAKAALQPLNHKSSEGDHPCYVTVDKRGAYVIAGNYSSGTAVAYVTEKDGTLGRRTAMVQHQGKGPVTSRQEKPHVHATYLSEDNRRLYVPDLGIDRIMIYAFNGSDGSLALADSADAGPGSGPRHIDIHPNGKYAYVIMELTGKVTAYAVARNGSLSPVQTISAAAPGYKGGFGSADIHVSPNGRYLYVSNRADANDIAIFSIDSGNGKLKLIGNQPVMGRTPRNFSIDPTGNYLLVANQNSDEIVVFSISKSTGLLTDTGKRIQVPNPVCLKWLKR